MTDEVVQLSSSTSFTFWHCFYVVWSFLGPCSFGIVYWVEHVSRTLLNPNFLRQLLGKDHLKVTAERLKVQFCGVIKMGEGHTE